MDAGQSHETFTMTSMLPDSERRREWSVGFAFSASVGWRDAADAGVVVVGWTGGAPAFFGGKGAAVSQRTKSALRKVPTLRSAKAAYVSDSRYSSPVTIFSLRGNVVPCVSCRADTSSSEHDAL